MPETLQFLIRHGYLILFSVVFVEQAGFPVASVPVLLGVGALSADGRFSFGAALLLALAACLPADTIWYELGKRRGYKVLNLLCRISLEPDTCVERTTGSFSRHGKGTLVVAKFVPGLSAVATPMAGLMKMRLGRFLLLDSLGAALWAGVYLTLGVVFRSELERIAAIVARTGASLAAVLICAIGGYFAWKWIGRRRYLRKIAMARISRKSCGAAWRLERNSQFSICATPRKSRRTAPRCRERYALRPSSWRHGIRKSRATGISCCIALDRTKPLAPVWRSDSERMESPASIRWRVAMRRGARRDIRSKPARRKSSHTCLKRKARRSTTCVWRRRAPPATSLASEFHFHPAAAGLLFETVTTGRQSSSSSGEDDAYKHADIRRSAGPQAVGGNFGPLRAETQRLRLKDSSEHLHTSGSSVDTIPRSKLWHFRPNSSRIGNLAPHCGGTRELHDTLPPPQGTPIPQRRTPRRRPGFASILRRLRRNLLQIPTGCA